MKHVDKCVHPEQPIGLRADGCIGFKPNAIVRWLIDEANEGRARNLNDISLRGFSAEDLTQFWQLLGTSVSAIGDQDFVDRKLVEKWDRIVEDHFKAQKERR